jgi:hypothetical protein
VPAQRVWLGEITVRVYDRGPEPAYHKDRDLYGPWLPYEAELADDPGVSATGWTPYEAIVGVVSARRAVLRERWAVEP